MKKYSRRNKWALETTEPMSSNNCTWNSS